MRGGAWTRLGGGHGPPTQALLVKMHVKTKELGACAGNFVWRSANDNGMMT